MKKHSLLLSSFALLVSLNVHASTNTYVGGALSIQDITADPSAYRGMRGGVFFGYQTSDDKDYYVAGELAASLVGTLSNMYESSDQNLRQMPTLSLSLIPGMMFSNLAVGFLRLGLAEALFSGDSTWRPGVVVGAGVEAALSSCWSVRAEYDYSFYRSLSVGVPRSDEFAFSLKYIFDV